MSAQSGRLQHALKHLREQWDIAQDTWDDPVSRDFEKNHSFRWNNSPKPQSPAWKRYRDPGQDPRPSARKTDGLEQAAIASAPAFDHHRQSVTDRTLEPECDSLQLRIQEHA